MKISPDTARSILELMTSPLSKYDMRNNDEVCVSNTYDVTTRNSTVGVIDGMKEMNDKLSEMKNVFLSMAIKMADSDGLPFLYTAKSSEQGKMRICANMELFKNFDDDKKMDLLREYITKTMQHWENQAKDAHGRVQYIADSVVDKCASLLNVIGHSPSLQNESSLDSKSEVNSIRTAPLSEIANQSRSEISNTAGKSEITTERKSDNPILERSENLLAKREKIELALKTYAKSLDANWVVEKNVDQNQKSVKVSDGTKEFSIHPDKVSTNTTDENVFKAMLVSFQAAHYPNNPSPRISTNGEQAKDIWIKVLGEMGYKNAENLVTDRAKKLDQHKELDVTAPDVNNTTSLGKRF